MRKYSELDNCYYGDTHPLYGGILIPLDILPLNYSFHVANGAWVGYLIKDGGHKKVCIPVINTASTLESFGTSGYWLDYFNCQYFFKDVPFDKNEKLIRDWFIFEQGTSKSEIYLWIMNNRIVTKEKSVDVMEDFKFYYFVDVVLHSYSKDDFEIIDIDMSRAIEQIEMLYTDPRYIDSIGDMIAEEVGDYGQTVKAIHDILWAVKPMERTYKIRIGLAFRDEIIDTPDGTEYDVDVQFTYDILDEDVDTSLYETTNDLDSSDNVYEQEYPEQIPDID